MKTVELFDSPGELVASRSNRGSRYTVVHRGVLDDTRCDRYFHLSAGPERCLQPELGTGHSRCASANRRSGRDLHTEHHTSKSCVHPKTAPSKYGAHAVYPWRHLQVPIAERRFGGKSHIEHNRFVSFKDKFINVQIFIFAHSRAPFSIAGHKRRTTAFGWLDHLAAHRI